MANRKGTKPLKSAVVICKLLSTEGFSDYTANQIERYWIHSAGLTDRQRRSVARLTEAMGRIATKLSTEERMALGRFIGLHKKMAFDTALRIGLGLLSLKAPDMPRIEDEIEVQP